MNKLILFTTPTCQPCKQMKPFIEEICSDLGIELINIDASIDKILVSSYEINSVPTLILLENSIEIKRSIGFKRKDQLEVWING